MNLLLWILGLLSVLPTALAAAAVFGLGVTRNLPALEVAATGTLLVALPILGIWALTGRQRWGLVFGSWTWPAFLLSAIPGYFPGELQGAIATGAAVFAVGGGRDVAKAAANAASDIAGKLPNGRLPPPEADRKAERCFESPVARGDDQVAIPYEGQGHSLAIPVLFGDGVSGETELPMLFDTGATLTTLNAESLRRLGVKVPRDAPEITLRTANGERTAKLVWVPEVWVGGLLVEGVTVGVCEECAGDKTAGLLGLNVSGQFLVTLDTVRKEVIFQARTGAPDRVVDVSPWLGVKASATLYPDQRVEVEVTAENRAPRAVKEATVGIRCASDHFEVVLHDIPAEGAATDTVSLPRRVDCQPYEVMLEHARW